MKKLLLFLAIIFSTHSHALEFQGKFLQGHFILGKAETGSKVFVDKTQVKVSEDGYFVFGIDRDRKFDVAITEINNGKKNISNIFIWNIFSFYCNKFSCSNCDVNNSYIDRLYKSCCGQ